MKKKMNGTTLLAMIGGMGMAGYIYMKKHPEVTRNMKKMVKNTAKHTYEMMDDID